MSERNNKLELLGSAPIPKALMSLGVPIMIGMLINALYNLVDAYFVSGLGKSQMGAISIVFPLGQVVVGLGLMFGNGAASYLSRLLGRGDKDTANKVASTALYSSLLIGAIIILFSTIFLKPILTMLGATETIMPYALTYSRIYILSCVFNVFNVTIIYAVFQCSASAKIHADFFTLVSVLNIPDEAQISIRDLFCVLGLHDAVIDPEDPGAKLDFFLRRAEWVDQFTNGFIQLFRRRGAF